MRSLLLIIALVLALLPTPARADDGARDPAAPSEAAAPASRSEGLALTLAIGGAIAGPALYMEARSMGHHYDLLDLPAGTLLACGALAAVGPSLGNWYAGKFWSAGLGVRMVGGAALGVGFVALFSNATAGVAIGASGLGVIGVGALMDIVEAPRNAGEFNRRHQLSIAPMIARTPAGQQTGIAVGGVF
jgi:hypothetical protein